MASGSSFNPMGPGRFFDACVPGGCAFSHTLPKQLFTTENHIFCPWTNFGQILARLLDLLQIFSIILAILAFSSKNEQKLQLLQNMA